MYKKILMTIGMLIGYTSFVSAYSRNLPGVNIISRAQWGANESWRYATESKTERDAARAVKKEAEMAQLLETDMDRYLELQRQEYEDQAATDYLISTTPTEQTVEEYRESSNGNYLKWPESIHKNKSKIIIHHTADDNASLFTWWKDAAIKQLQDIYKYHTLTKWRWDIWYNFIIDPFGNIYEWRAWGDGVVAAHVSWNNTPSVGISLMGNFNVNVPTDAALKSLTQLTTSLARKYKINPKATVSYFKGSNDAPYVKSYTNYTIAGHTDAWVTACPGENLYALLPEIREQVSKNLSSVSLISTPMTVNVRPSVNRWITVAWRYYSDLTTDTFELPIRWPGVTSCKTSDTTIAINSCSSRAGKLVISLTKKWSSGLKTISAVTASWTKTFSMNIVRKDDFDGIADDVKQEYMTRKWITASSQNISKITSKISVDAITSLINTPLTILLYELSMNYPRYDITCDGGCAIVADGKEYSYTSPAVEVGNGFIYLRFPDVENPISVQDLEISSANGGLVTVTNYTRKSYGGTPWNTFRWSLIWHKEQVKNLSAWTYVEQAVVMNRTTFNNYMKGIAETSDTENRNKQKIVLLLAKMYTLFYINGENVHPSVPAGASYQAIDNPDMFQKYVGAWREKTSTMSASLLADIEDKVILYDGYVPILPYFSCSAGFTRSAKEKRWWTDTPYLQSKVDFAPCFDFNGHGVGLSGKWAQYLAQQWRTVEQILQYYYPGVELTTLE